MIRTKIINRLRSSGIEELASVVSLTELDGDYLNLECRLPNGKYAKVLDDGKKYYAAQVELRGGDRCLGVAADDDQIAVFSYGCGGRDAELVMWIRL